MAAPRSAPSVLDVPPADLSHRKTYLDKDAISLLWRCESFSDRILLRHRRRLQSGLNPRRPNIVLSQWLLREMASWLKHPKVERQISAELDFVVGLPSFLLLKSPLDILESEVQAVLHRKVPRVFFDPGWRFELDTPGVWPAEFAALRADGAAFKSRATGGIERIGKRFPNRGVLVKQFAKELKDDTELSITRLALQWVRSSRKELGLPRSEDLWPSPKLLPSTWARAAFAVMFSYLTTRDQRKPDGNDLLGWCHYSSSVHADEFVTNDSWARRVAALCPPPKPTVLSFEDWAEGILMYGIDGECLGKGCEARRPHNLDDEPDNHAPSLRSVARLRVIARRWAAAFTFRGG